jgi:hypothetical protein
MGYCMTQQNSKFLIKKENHGAAYRAIQELGQTGKDFHWVKASDFANMTDLLSALQEWRWEPSQDDDGNIVDLNFTGEKLGADKELFDAIAPFVEPSSFIEMNGEDHATWRWVFDGKTCRDIEPEIIWER